MTLYEENQKHHAREAWSPPNLERGCSEIRITRRHTSKIMPLIIPRCNLPHFPFHVILPRCSQPIPLICESVLFIC